MTHVSIIIATKNGASYISRALKSIFDQTFAIDHLTKDLLEVLVVDDGSTDSTASLVQEFAAFEPRVRLISLEHNVGPGLARHTGIQQSRGQYIAFIDDDDLWISPDKLMLQYEFLHTHPDHVLVGATQVHVTDEHGMPIRLHINPSSDAQIRQALLRRNCFATSSVLFKKDAYEQAGGFKPMYLAEDYDLWFRMGIKGKFANLDACDIRYTVRPHNASTTNALKMNKINLELVKTYKKNYPGYVLALMKAHARILYLQVKNLF